MQRVLPFLLTAVLSGSLFAQVQEISPREYSVLSDFLRIQLEGKSYFRVGPKGSVIAPYTDATLKHLAVREGEWMKSRLTGLTSDTLAAFEHCADLQMLITRKFDLPTDYQIVRPVEFRDLDMDGKEMKAFYAEYPNTNGIIQFSCVGINASGSQALFFVERNGHAPNGQWILMEKDASGKWLLKSQLIKWMV